MPAALIGAFLGFCNVLFIALGLEARDPSLPAHYVIMFGLIPGVSTGALCGWIADSTRSFSPWLRRGLLAIAPLGLVGSLAGVFEMAEHLYVASIPTLVAVMVLERWTRSPAKLPAATVERS
jgi:hypothetical protein